MKLSFARALPVVLVLGLGCSDAADEPTDPAVGGAGSGSGGAVAATTGGSGGSVGAGGNGSSGATSSGGTVGQGGSGNGGSVSSGASGGTASGGASGVGAGTGGTSAGGASTGGASAGGASTGGTSAGGASTGGASAGGANTGGTAPLDGKGLYDADCKACHGEQGVGGPLGPEVMHPVRDYSTWVIRNGRTPTTYPAPMAKWGTDKLSDAQLALIYDYLDKPPQPATGKALYADYCASCHGADGKGGPTGRSIVNEVAKVISQTRSGKNVGKFDPRRDYMPAFTTTQISDAELNSIRDYVDSL